MYRSNILHWQDRRQSMVPHVGGPDRRLERMRTSYGGWRL